MATWCEGVFRRYKGVSRRALNVVRQAGPRKVADPLGTAMRAISNQSMNVGIGDAEVRALLIGTGEALGVYPLGGSPPAFDLAPGAYRRRRRSHS